MAGINQADVELTLGVNMMLDNEEEFAEALSNLQNSDAVINVGGVEKSLGNISQQLLTILQSETEITQKSKELGNALGNNTVNIKKIFETTINQATSNLNDTYSKAQNAKKSGNVVEYYSLLQSSKGQAKTLQTFSRKYKENFGELPQINIGNNFYKSDDLEKFINDLDIASKAQNEFISKYSELKKQLTNSSDQVKKDLINDPAISSMLKNTIGSLGKQFNSIETDIKKNLKDNNLNGLSDKLEKMSQITAATNYLMDKSGIDWIKTEDTNFKVSVKRRTDKGINSRFDNILNEASAKDKNIDTSIFKQISENASKADKNVLNLIEGCFELEQSEISKKSNNTITNSVEQVKKNNVTEIPKEDKKALKEQMQLISDLGNKTSNKNYKELVNIFDKIAKINYDNATKQFEKLAKSFDLLEKDETIQDFEDIYEVSFYKPEYNSVSNSTNSDNNKEQIDAAIKSQQQAEEKAQQYKSQIESLNSQIANKDTELKKINDKVNDLRKQLNQASENSSSEKSSQLESQIEKKNKEKIALEKTIEELRSQLSESKPQNGAEDNSAEIIELQRQISDKTKENENLKKANKELQDSLNTNSSQTSNVQNNIEQINKAIADFYNAVDNDISLEQQKQMLEEIIDLYKQLPDNEVENSKLDLSQSAIQADLNEVNDLIEEQNKKRQEEIQLINEAKIKETELYQQIIKYQNEYDKTQSQEGAYLGLNKRKERKEYQNKLVSAIGSKKKKLQEQYPDFSSDELWSDNKISETKVAITKSLNGLREKVTYAEEQSLKFVENTNKIFDEYSNKYNQTTSLKDKQKILDEMISKSNQINNDIVPIEEATQQNLDKGFVATSEAISQTVKKFDDFVVKKQQELLNIQQEAKKSSKTIEQTKKSEATTSTSVQQDDTKISSPNVITSPKDFVKVIESKKKIKKNIEPEKMVQDENTDFSKLETSVDNVIQKINNKTEAIKNESNIVTEVVNNEINDFERLREKIEEVTEEVNKKNNTLENIEAYNEEKNTDEYPNNSDKEIITDNATDKSFNNITPFNINDVAISEEAIAKLNTEITNAIGTIYVSDVKLAEGVLLTELQKEISDVLNVNPIEVQILPNINNDNKEENNDGSINGINVNISSISFANEEIATALKSKIEEALSPIFIRQFDGENADISSLENRISLALNVIKIDRVELNENFDASSLQKDIEKYLSAIKVEGIDTSVFAQSIKTDIENALAQLNIPKVGTKVKFTDKDQTKFDRLSKALDIFSKAVERKNQAIASFTGNEVSNIEILLNKIRELKEALSSIKAIKVLSASTDESSDNDNSPKEPKVKKDTKKVIDVIEENVDTSPKKDTEAKDKKAIATQKEKNKLLEEELEIRTEIAKKQEEINKLNEKAENEQLNKEEEQKPSELKKQQETNQENLNDTLTQRNELGITKQDEENFVKNKYEKIITVQNKEATNITKSQKSLGIKNTEKAITEFNKITKATKEYDNANKNTIETLAKLNAITQNVIETNQKQRDEVKNNTGENALNTKYERLITKMKKWASDNSLAMKDETIYKDYYKILNELNDVSKRSSEGITKLEGDFSKLEGQIQETGQTGKTFTGEMKNLFNVLGDRAIVGMVIEGVKNKFRQMIDNVKEIDAAMTELKKVTNETSATYNNFLKSAGSKASDLGSTMTDLISSTADFAKLGYSIEDASVLAENAIMYSNVGDLDIQTATSDIVSALKAFDIDASNAIKIVDSFNEVGNNYAVSAQQIGEALQNSASSLVVAGNDIDQSIAMITAMTEITQDASSAGAALRTLSLRIRGAKTELSDLGESTEDMATSTAKLRDQIKGMTGVDIMIDDSTFKSTYQIIQEISKVWDKLNDIDRTAILELMAGKNRSNQVSALISNFSQAEKAYDTSVNSEGSAVKENAAYIDSIQGRIAQLKATFQDLSNDVINSELFKFIVTSLNNIIKLLDVFVESFAGIPIILSTVAFALKKKFSFIESFLNIGKDNEKINNWGKSIKSTLHKVLTDFQKEADNSPINVNVKTTGEVNSSTTSSTLTDVASDVVEGTTSKTGLASGLASSLLSFGKLAAIALVIEGTVKVIQLVIEKFFKSVQKAKEKVSELSEEYNDVKDKLDSINTELEENQQKIEEINANGLDFTGEELEELQKQNEQLNLQKQYLEDIEAIKKQQLNNATQELLDLKTYPSLNKTGIKVTAQEYAQEQIDKIKDLLNNKNEILNSSEGIDYTSYIKTNEQISEMNDSLIETMDYLTEQQKTLDENSNLYKQINDLIEQYNETNKSIELNANGFIDVSLDTYFTDGDFDEKTFKAAQKKVKNKNFKSERKVLSLVSEEYLKQDDFANIRDILSRNDITVTQAVTTNNSYIEAQSYTGIINALEEIETLKEQGLWIDNLENKQIESTLASLTQLTDEEREYVELISKLDTYSFVNSFVSNNDLGINNLSDITSDTYIAFKNALIEKANQEGQDTQIIETVLANLFPDYQTVEKRISEYVKNNPTSELSKAVNDYAKTGNVSVKVNEKLMGEFDQLGANAKSAAGYVHLLGQELIQEKFAALQAETVQAKQNFISNKTEYDDNNANINEIYTNAISSITNGSLISYDDMWTLINADAELATKFTKSVNGYKISLDDLKKSQNKYIEDVKNTYLNEINDAQNRIEYAKNQINKAKSTLTDQYSSTDDKAKASQIIYNYNKEIEENTRLIAQNQLMYEQASNSVLNYSEQLENVLNKLSTFKTLYESIIKDTSKVGRIGAESMIELINAFPDNWQDFIKKSDNGYQLDTKAYNQVYTQTIVQDLGLSGTDEATIVNDLDKEIGNSLHSLANKYGIVYDKGKSLAEQFKEIRTKAGQTAITSQDFYNNLSNLETQFKDTDIVASMFAEIIQTLIDSLEESEAITNFNDKVSDLQHQLNMGLINQAQYDAGYAVASKEFEDTSKNEGISDSATQEQIWSNQEQIYSAQQNQYQKDFNKKTQDLQDAYDRRLISAKEYYDKLAKIEDEYYGSENKKGLLSDPDGTNVDDKNRQQLERKQSLFNDEISRIKEDYSNKYISFDDYRKQYEEAIEAWLGNSSGLEEIYKEANLEFRVTLANDEIEKIKEDYSKGLISFEEFENSLNNSLDYWLGNVEELKGSYDELERENISTLYEEAIDLEDKALERGELTNYQYAQDMINIWKKYYKDKDGYRQEDLAAERQAVEASKQAAQSQIDAFQHLIDKNNEDAEGQINELQNQKDKIERAYDKQIETLQTQKDLISDAVDKEDRRLKILEAQKELQNSTQYTRQVYGADGSISFKPDTEKIEEAQKSYNDTITSEILNLIQDDIDALEKQKEEETDPIDEKIYEIEQKRDEENKYLQAIVDMLGTILEDSYDIDSDYVNRLLNTDDAQAELDKINKEREQAGEKPISWADISSAIHASEEKIDNETTQPEKEDILLNATQNNDSTTSEDKVVEKASSKSEETLKSDTDETLNKNDIIKKNSSIFDLDSYFDKLQKLLGTPIPVTITDNIKNSIDTANQGFRSDITQINTNNNGGSLTFTGDIIIQNPVSNSNDLAKELMLNLPNAFQNQIYTNLK